MFINKLFIAIAYKINALIIRYIKRLLKMDTRLSKVRTEIMSD